MTSRANKKRMERIAGVRSMNNQFGRVPGLAMARGVKMIEGDDKARANKCLQEIQAVCERYDCSMTPEITISAGEIRAAVRIQAKPRDGGQRTEDRGQRTAYAPDGGRPPIANS